MGKCVELFREQIQEVRNKGGMDCPKCGRSMRALKGVKPELYCELCHLSVPLYSREQKPIDPLAKWRN